MNGNTSRRDVLRATVTTTTLGLASGAALGKSRDETVDRDRQPGVHVSNDSTAEKQITVLVRGKDEGEVIYMEQFVLPGFNEERDLAPEQTQAETTIEAIGDGRYVAEAVVPGEGKNSTEVVMTRYGMAKHQRLLVSIGPTGDIDVMSYFT